MAGSNIVRSIPQAGAPFSFGSPQSFGKASGASVKSSLKTVAARLMSRSVRGPVLGSRIGTALKVGSRRKASGTPMNIQEMQYR